MGRRGLRAVRAWVMAVAVGLAAGAVPSAVRAATYILPDDAADFMWTDQNTVVAGNPSAGVVGGQSYAGYGRNTLLFFPVPLLAPGETVKSASLSVYLVSKVANNNALTFNCDAYLDAYGYSLGEYAEYYVGPNRPNSNKVGEDLFKPLSAIGQFHTTGAGETTLAENLGYFYKFTPNYAGGAYAAIHLVPDATALTTDLAGYQPALYEGGTGTRAYMTLVTNDAPEPAGLSLLALAALPLARRRRR